MEFKELLILAGLTIPSAADLLGVSKTTIYRYIRHGAPAMAHRALEFRAGTNPDYWGMQFRRDGVWCESRRLVERNELNDLGWRVERAFRLGQVEGLRMRATTSDGIDCSDTDRSKRS